MGVLAEIYVSRDDQEAVTYDTTPDAFAKRRQYRNFTAVHLSTLWAIMQGVGWHVGLLDEFPELLGLDDGERLVHRLPKAMVEGLSRMTPEAITVSSTKWAATDEFRCQPSDVQPIIEGLVQLSTEASASGSGVYLWNCV
jgi:hypothetical protein